MCSGSFASYSVWRMSLAPLGIRFACDGTVDIDSAGMVGAEATGCILYSGTRLGPTGTPKTRCLSSPKAFGPPVVVLVVVE